MGKIKCTCLYCGKSFVSYLNGRKTIKFCSLKCANKASYRREIRKCVVCEKEFEVRKSQTKKFCSHSCYSKSLVGKKQKHVSDIGRLNISTAKMGERNPMYGIYGEKHHNWKGGKSEISQLIRGISEYKKWRDSVFKKDKYTCQRCGKVGGHIEAHHIKRFSLILDENNIKSIEDALTCKKLWEKQNGKTLCKRCHDKSRGRNAIRR